MIEDLLKKRLECSDIAAELLAYVYENNLYQLNKNMIVLCGFGEKPICGKYQTVIFDKKDGIILCHKNSR